MQHDQQNALVACMALCELQHYIRWSGENNKYPIRENEEKSEPSHGSMQNSGCGDSTGSKMLAF